MDSKQNPDQPSFYDQELVRQSLPVSAPAAPSYGLQPTFSTPPPNTAVVHYPGAEPLPVVIQPGQKIQQNTSVNQVVAPATTVFVGPARPSNYFCLSIFSCLCCCWPIGAAAIVYSLKVDSSYADGDFDGALRNSMIVRRLIIFSILYGVGLLIFLFTLRNLPTMIA